MGDRTPNEHLLSPNEASSNETELWLMEFLTKGVPWTWNNMVVVETIRCSLQIDSNNPLLKTPTQLTEHEDKLAPTKSLYPY